MSEKSIKILKENLVLVEGHEEELFFEALLKHMGLNSIQVLPIAGKNNLRANLKMLVVSPRYSAVVKLGIVRDADKDPKAAFQSVCGALEMVNLPVPKVPLVPTGRGPQVTVMILPGDDRVGMLEDVCLRIVGEDPAMFCVEKYFDCLQERNVLMPRNSSKAKVQVFLGSRLEAGKRLGEAAQAGYWPWDHKAVEQIKNFLTRFTTIASTDIMSGAEM
jgi:hypothetical protein